MDKKHISKIYHNGDTLYVKDAEARETMVSGVSYDTTNKKIVETINGVNSDVVSVSTIKSDLNLTKSDVSLSNVTNDAQVKRTEMGVASGVATLDSAGKVPASQLPSYVDDVVEYASRSAFPETGETGKIYVDKATNEVYRWSGSQYIAIADSQVQANWNTTDSNSKSYIQNKPIVVSDVLFNSTTNKLQKTINGTTSDVVTIISGGFQITMNETTGIDTLSAIGGASITYNTSTGIDSFVF